MKQKKGFNIRQICGQNMIVAEGLENIDYSNIISMNDTATFLWNSLKGRDFTVEDMADLLTGEYEVDRDTALADCRALAEQWKKAEIIY